MHGLQIGGSLHCPPPEPRDVSAMPAARSSASPETLCAFVRTITKAHGHAEELSMQKFYQSGYAFALVALLFFVVGVVSDRPAVYVGLGAVFLILAFAVRKRNAQKAQQTTHPSQ